MKANNQHSNEQSPSIQSYQLQSKYQIIKTNEATLLKNTYWKYLFLFFSATLSTGAYYCYNIPSLIREEIRSKLGVTEQTYSLLFSIPGIPNIVLCFFGGYFIDFVGFKIASFSFTFIVLVAEIVVTIGAYNGSYITIFVALIFFNIGLESTTMTQNAFTSSWFIGTGRLSLAIGVIMFQLRFIETVSSWTVGPLYSIDDEVYEPMFVGDFVCLFSLIISSGGASIMDYIQNKQKAKISRLEKVQMINSLQKSGNYTLYEDSEYRSSQYSEQNNANVAELQQQLIQQEKQNDNNKVKNKIRFKDVKEFEKLYWLLNITCACGYMIFYPFMQQMETILKEEFLIGVNQAGDLQSIPYFVALGTPFVGVFIDKFGQRPIIIMICFIILLVNFVIWTFLPSCSSSCVFQPVFPLVLLGLFLCLFAGVIFSCVPLVVKKEHIGMAYGTLSSIKAIGLTVGPQVNTAILDSGGFTWLYVYQILLSAVGIGLSFTIIYKDKLTNNRLKNNKRKDTIDEDTLSKLNLNTGDNNNDVTQTKVSKESF